MTFVWKTTCRRLQSSGELSRFAEGHATGRERGEIEAHLAACPACQAIVADTLAVTDLLKSSVPAAPTKSLAASGALWAALESEIARTPQEPVLAERNTTSGPVSAPRLQRFGRWLATPGAMPFGTVAAAAVVGMVGIFTYQRMGPAPLENQTASVSTAVGDSEFTLLPPPTVPAPSAGGEAAKSMEPSHEPLARGVAAPAPRSVDAIEGNALSNKIAPLETELTLRQSKSPAAPSRLPLSLAAPLPAAPHAPAARMAKDVPTDLSASTAAAPAPPVPLSSNSQMADTATRPPATNGFGGGLGGGAGAQARFSSARTRTQADGAAPPAPPLSAPEMVAKARAVPSPLPVSPGVMAFATVSGSSENLSGEVHDVPAARSLLDMTLRQRRQRSLFSYATR